MRNCYSVFIHFYDVLLHFASFFNKKAKKWLEERKNQQIDLSQKIKEGKFLTWIHCASAGEFEQAIPLIKEIRNREPKSKIAVSFFSPSGMNMYKDSGLADLFFYLPLDTSENADKLIESLHPKIVIFIRNEIWWNILTALNKKNIPVYLVNANLEQKRFFFYKKYLDQTYPLFTKIFDTKTFGNTKLERVIESKNEIYRDEILEVFCKNSFVIILGSSWEIEEKYIADFYKKNKEKILNLKIIIAPHEYDETKEKELENLFGEKIVSYSQFSSLNTQLPILFLDKKGILKYIYRYANIAFIGGGFGKGVHNISEAGVYCIPTLFGNNYGKFEEINELTGLNIAFPVKEYIEFEKKLLQLINDVELRNNIYQKLNIYFSQQEKTSERIISETMQ